MMDRYSIRNFNREDAESVNELQKNYNKMYPDTYTDPVELFDSSEFYGGQDVFCAFDREGSLAGYASVFTLMAMDESVSSNVLSIVIKIDTALKHSNTLRGLLFDKLIGRAIEILENAPVKNTKFRWSCSPDDKASIDFALSKGFQTIEGAYYLARDLQEPVPIYPVSDNIKIVPWKMKTEEEVTKYLQAHNIAYPESSLPQKGMDTLMQSELWAVGTVLAAFSGDDIAGSVILFWDPESNKKSEKKTAYTEHLFVMPDWRKCGIAIGLISRGLSYLKEQGMDQVCTQVSEYNEKTLKLYNKMGYKTVRVEKIMELDISKLPVTHP